MNKKTLLGGDTPVFFWIGFLTVACVYGIGALLDIMDVDAAQYASMSRDMMVSGDYFKTYERGKDYLDKPPLLFWFSALAFYLFGVANFTYRIFPILSTFLAAYAVFRFSKLYYTKSVGYLSATTLLSCQAYFLINHDVRTDTMLANAVMCAIWLIAEYNEKRHWKYLIGGFVFIAVAMLAKGPLGLMVPVLAFSTDFILKRKWGSFFKWQWLVGLGVVALILLPMCIGLYQQFDLHPEKVVNNRTGTSGLYFYFWSHSFGRITGEDDFIIYVHKSKALGDPFFYVHSFAWSFLPWAVFYFMGAWRAIAVVIRQRFKLLNQQEALTLGGFILPCIVISFSQYKLPQHIYVSLPLAAITTGKVLYDILYEDKLSKLFRITYGIQVFVVFALWALSGLLAMYCFPMSSVLNWLVISGFVLISCYYVFVGKNRYQRLVLPSLFTIIGVNFLLNAHIYPTLFQYQAPTVIAKYARNTLKVPPKRLFVYDERGNLYHFSLDLYSETYIGGRLHTAEDILKAAQSGKCWVFTNAAGLAVIQGLGQAVKVLSTTQEFRVSLLTLPFLNPATRAKEVRKTYLLEFALKR